MDAKEIEQMRDTYRRLPDYDIAELHARGASGLRSPAFWILLQEEFDRRQQTARDDSLLTLSRQAQESIEEANLAERRQLALASFYAPWYVRIGASGVDGILYLIAVSVWGVVGRSLSIHPDIVAIVAVLGYFGYQVVPEATSGATPGKRVFGLRVVTAQGARPTLGQLIVRAILKPFLFFGLLWYLLWKTPWGHDVLTSTRVVRVGTHDLH